MGFHEVPREEALGQGPSGTVHRRCVGGHDHGGRGALAAACGHGAVLALRPHRLAPAHAWADPACCVARLRALAGTDPDAPDAPDLTRLAGELMLKSPEFARLWERYDVRGHSYGRKTFHHPDVGDSPSASSPWNWKAPPATAW